MTDKESLELQRLDPDDPVVLGQRTAARSKPPTHQAVQHGQEDRALQREVMLARAR